MSKNWSINSNEPDRDEKYEWHYPGNEDQYGEQTVTPGDMAIKPKDLSLKPTNPPKRSGIQHGQDDWNYQSSPDPSWYIYGMIIREEN